MVGGSGVAECELGGEHNLSGILSRQVMRHVQERLINDTGVTQGSTLLPTLATEQRDGSMQLHTD